jgi:uncharacterized protein
MTLSRRSFVLRSGGTALGLAVSGSLPAVLGAQPALAARPGRVGYGPLVPDPAGVLDLPEGFHYRMFSRVGIDVLDDGSPVPASHDGMAAFAAARHRTWLVRNHEIAPEDVEEEGLAPVPHVPGHTYDPNGTGGTTTLLVGPDRRLVSHRVSLAGTVNNCAGGPTPWGTWLTCEETDEIIDGIRHGYVFEVDPVTGGDPAPLGALGRFEHEAVSFDPRTGAAYLTEDADGPHGLFYRCLPQQPLGGRGSLHAGGALHALRIPELAGTDLSAVTSPGTTFTSLEWLPVGQVDPGADDEPTRVAAGGTPIPKCEGTWWGGGRIWFVSSRGEGPGAEDPGEASAAAHGGQIWVYDPVADSLRLVVRFEQDDDFEGPDNITVAPYGFAVMCTDGEDDDQFLAGIAPDGQTFPLAYNRLSGDEFAGATFSPDGHTLFVNIQDPGTTFAIWGPWTRGGRQ